MPRTPPLVRSARLLCAAAVLLALLPGAAFAGSSSWAYQGDAAHTGRIDDPRLADLEPAWSRELGTRLTMSVVSDRRAFVSAVEDDGARTMLHALELATGRTLWVRQLEGASALAAEDGRLFATSPDGLVERLDPATGRTLWRVPFVGGAPVAADGLIVYRLGQYSLAARDQTDGSVAWTTYVGDLGGLPTVAGGRVYTTDDCYGSAAYDLRTGAKLWASGRECDGDVIAAFSSVDDGRVWTGTGAVRDAATGALLGRVPNERVAALGGGSAYLVEGGRLVARDAVTRQERWRDESEELAMAPLTTGADVLSVTVGGRLRVLDGATGVLLDEHDLGGTLGSGWTDSATGMAAGEGMLLVPARGRLVAFRAAAAGLPPARSAPPVAPMALDPQLPAGGTSDDATAFQQDAAHSGVLRAGAPRLPLRERWTAPITGAGHALIADGKVFVVALGPPELEGVLALDAADGHVLWRATFDTGWTLGAKPAYDDGKLFVYQQKSIHAFDADTGARLWRTSQEFPDDDWPHSAPVAAGGLVYAGDSFGQLAFRATDGSRAWRRGATGREHGTPAVAGGAVWSMSTCGGWFGTAGAGTATITDATGSCNGGGMGQVPVIANGEVYARDYNVARIVDATTGEAKGGIRTDKPPVVAHGHRFVLDGGALTAMPVDGGPVRWVAGRGLGLNTPPLVVGDHVYVASSQGRLHAFDPDTGRIDFTADLGSPALSLVEDNSLYRMSAPSAGEGLLAVPTDAGLVAFESAAEPDPGPDPAPEPPATPEPEPSATPGPTVTPSPEPTAEPTASPTIELASPGVAPPGAGRVFGTAQRTAAIPGSARTPRTLARRLAAMLRSPDRADAIRFRYVAPGAGRLLVRVTARGRTLARTRVSFTRRGARRARLAVPAVLGPGARIEVRFTPRAGRARAAGLRVQ